MANSWYTAWAEAFLPFGRWVGPLSWLTARDHADNLLAAIPLARQQLMGLATVSLGGYYWPFRTLPMATGDGVITQTCRAIATFVSSQRRAKAWRLGPVVRDDAAMSEFRQSFAGQGWTVTEKAIGKTYAVILPADWPLYEREVGGHLLKKVAYFERRLRKLGTVEIFAVHPTDQEKWHQQLEDLATLERNSWVAKRENGTTKFLGPRNRRFWERVVSTDSVVEALQVWMLYFNGKPISYSLNINSGTTKYILANGYDEAFKEHSTGTILAYHVLRDACLRRITTVEWGLGDSGYKTRWHATPRLELMDYVLLPPSTVGRMQAAIMTNIGWSRSETHS